MYNANPQTIYINGRFLTQPISGVQRYAHEWVLAVDNLLANQDAATAGLKFVLLTPAKGELHSLPLNHIDFRRAGNLQGHGWEQLNLPGLANDGLLFCPGNTAPLSSLRGKTPVVATVHDLSYLYFPAAYSVAFRAVYRTLIPAVFRRADAVITVSESEKASILKYYPNVQNKLSAIQNGGLGERFRGAAEAPLTDAAKKEAPYLLYVGALNRRKNPQGILQALAQLREELPVKLIVAGSGGKSFRNDEFGVPADIVNQVEFKGQINDTRELIKLYRGAAALVFPSFYEASPLPPIEAMACGCPVIASTIPSLQERCGDAALFCDPDQPADIAAALRKILQDEKLQTALREKGKARAKKFTWENCAKATLRIIRNVLNMDGK